MKKTLALVLLLIMTTASAQDLLPLPRQGWSDLVRVGLTDTDTSAGGTARLCEHVVFSRGLRYGALLHAEQFGSI